MIVLKDILTKDELKRTKIILFSTKYKFGNKDYNKFKKMILVVGYTYGLTRYIPYSTFITRAEELMKKNISPIYTWEFETRKLNEDFFGIRKKIILTSTLYELTTIMINRRNYLLK